MNAYKAPFAVETELRTLEEALDGADIFIGLSVKGDHDPNHGVVDGAGSRHLCPGQPGSGDPAGGRSRDSGRRHHGYRTVRLPQPGKQRPGLSIHLPGRNRCARARDQRGDDARRDPAPSPSWRGWRCPRRCAGAYGHEDIVFGRDYLIPKPFDHRVLFHVAPAVAEGGHANRHGAPGARPGRVSGPPAGAAGSGARGHDRDPRAGPPASRRASSSRRATTRT